MQDITHYGHSVNLIGIPTACIADRQFNQYPQALHISGVRSSASGLFDQLKQQTQRSACGHIFQDYMSVVFGFEPEQRLRQDAQGRRRFKSSYLALIQDWGIDSNTPQGAVFKGWVESRFGLFPTYHKGKIANFIDQRWLGYIEDKMNCRFHNNCIYMQLDLLYEYCQWVIDRFRSPADSHLTLYRGVNSFDECVIQDCRDAYKHIRLNNISSFTDKKSIASEFGAYILEVHVPLVKLVFFSDLLPQHGLRGESEYLVIGGDYLAKITH